MLEVHRLPALKDNYVWLVVDPAAREAVVVDPTEAAPVLSRVDSLGVRLTAIWNTHHHGDHVGGNRELLARYGELEVLASASDQAEGRIPGQTRALVDGESFTFGGERVEVLFVPAHTRGHIAYRLPGRVFVGDTLFGAGCGRLFEGTASQMYSALSRLRALPDDTLVYCAHEYTLSNLRFALEIEPDNPALRDRHTRVTASPGEPTVPLRLGEEKATNPFLRWDSHEVKHTVGGGTAVEVFAEVRRRKDVWRGS